LAEPAILNFQRVPYRSTPWSKITEALTHLAFYAGWAQATKAITAVARALGK
jgi:hypothetical protein